MVAPLQASAPEIASTNVEGDDVISKRALREFSGWRQSPRAPVGHSRRERLGVDVEVGTLRNPGGQRRDRPSNGIFSFNLATLPHPVHLARCLFCVLVCCLLLTACEKPPPLRIGLMPWPTYESLRVAEHKGFFAAEGTNVRLLHFATVADTRRAFERKQLDGMCCTLPDLLNSSRHPRAVFVFDSSEGSDVIIARAPISRVEELRNRVVAVEPATVNVFLLARALQQAGLSIDAVRLRSMATTDMSLAFSQGEIDAATAYPPASHELLRQPGAQVIFSSKSIPNEIFDVLAFGSSVLQERRSDVVAVIRALDRAEQFATAHPEEAVAVMAKYAGITPEEFKAELVGVRIISAKEQAKYFTPGGPLQQALGMAADALRAAGHIQSPVDPAALTADLFTPANEK
ncbi:ABC transporter substrate-binding protein [Verrucomicrobiota bacterium sgz303538]